MKLHIISDLHTEIGPYDLATRDFDLLILAGDIGTGTNGLKWIRDQKIQQPILYLAGNHEYYKNALPHLTYKLRDETVGTNIHFLENDEFIHQGIRFLGATMWTDYMLTGDGMSAWHANQNMNDYEQIRVSPEYRRVHTDDLLSIHRKSIKWLQEKLNTPFDGKTVVITHHAPSAKSLRRVDFISPAYASNLERFMGPNVPLWIHGHTHVPVDYEINGTRVLSNPRGYKGKDFDHVPRDFKPDLIVEI